MLPKTPALPLCLHSEADPYMARKRKLRKIINLLSLIAFESRMIENPSDSGYNIFWEVKNKALFYSRILEGR